MPVSGVSRAHACAWARSYAANVERLYRSAAIYFDRGTRTTLFDCCPLWVARLPQPDNACLSRHSACRSSLLVIPCTLRECHDSCHYSMCVLAHVSHHGFWLWLADNVGLPGVSMFFKVRAHLLELNIIQLQNIKSTACVCMALQRSEICMHGLQAILLRAHALHAIGGATCSQPATSHGLHEKSQASILGYLPLLFQLRLKSARGLRAQIAGMRCPGFCKSSKVGFFFFPSLGPSSMLLTIKDLVVQDTQACV